MSGDNRKQWSDQTSEWRAMAKRINFAVIYGKPIRPVPPPRTPLLRFIEAVCKADEA